MPYAKLEPWPAALDEVRAAGFTVIAMTPAADAVPLQDTDLKASKKTRTAAGRRGARAVREGAVRQRRAGGDPDAAGGRFAQRRRRGRRRVLGGVPVSAALHERARRARPGRRCATARPGCSTAGGSLLDRPVRWPTVHWVAEVPDIATLLRGGELVLMTGIGMPEDDDGIRAFVAALAGVGVVGLIVELGRRYQATLPQSHDRGRDQAFATAHRTAQTHSICTHHRSRARPDRGLATRRTTGHRGDPPAVHRAVRRRRRGGRGGRAGRGAGPGTDRAGEPVSAGPRLRHRRRPSRADPRRLGGALAADRLGRPHHLRRRHRLARHHGRRPRPGLGPTVAALVTGGPGRRRGPADPADDPAGTGRVDAGARSADPT